MPVAGLVDEVVFRVGVPGEVGVEVAVGEQGAENSAWLRRRQTSEPGSVAPPRVFDDGATLCQLLGRSTNPVESGGELEKTSHRPNGPFEDCCRMYWGCPPGLTPNS